MSARNSSEMRPEQHLAEAASLLAVAYLRLSAHQGRTPLDLSERHAHMSVDPAETRVSPDTASGRGKRKEGIA